MKTLLRAVVLMSIIMGTMSTQARETISNHSIERALGGPDFGEKVGNSVRFYFGSQATAPIARKGGSYNTSRKASAIGKTDEQACDRAFLSALIALRDKALEEGGNAVINIKSTYKGGEYSSQREYRCGSGNVVSGVSLKGTVATLN